LHQIINPDYLLEKIERGRRRFRYTTKVEDFILQDIVKGMLPISKCPSIDLAKNKIISKLMLNVIA